MRAFHLFRILAFNREPIALGTMVQSLLSCRDVVRRTFPDFHRGSLERASKGETQLPGNIAYPANGVQSLRSRFITLSSGKKDDPGNRGRHRTKQTEDGRFSYFRNISFLRTVLTR